MIKKINKLEIKVFDFFLSKNSKKNIEKYVLIASVIGFIIHLALIYLYKFDLLDFNDPYNLLNKTN